MQSGWTEILKKSNEFKQTEEGYYVEENSSSIKEEILFNIKVEAWILTFLIMPLVLSICLLCGISIRYSVAITLLSCPLMTATNLTLSLIK